MPKSLSSYWAGNSHRAMAGASSPETRLAIALSPIRSIIRVIDDSKPPMSVDWCRVGKDNKGKPLSMSFTDFRGSRIAVNPLPIIEGTLDAGAAIDVAAGFAMHEASHAKHSRDRYQYLVKSVPIDKAGTASKEVPAFEPMKVAGYLWNLAEDIRIEGLTSKEWPGFAAYFDAVLDYMWHEPQAVDLDEKASAWMSWRLSLVYHALRYPDRIAERRSSIEANLSTLLREGLGSPLDIDTEIAWWQAWQADYLTEVTDVPTAIQRGLDHLREDEQTASDMDRQTADERAEREAGEKLRAQIERLIREGIDGVPGCVSEDGETTPLSAEVAEAVDKLVKEGLTAVTPIIKHRGSKMPEMRVRKPTETAQSRRSYVGSPDAATEALRAALVFRSESPRWDLKLQKTGVLDDEELYRWGMGEDRLFSQRVVEDRPDTDIELLVDLSGSMTSWSDEKTSKLATAQRLAQQFIWALHDMEGVTTGVWGHTGDSYAGSGSDVFRLWEPGDPLSRLGLITALDHGNNYDGYALQYVADQVRTRSQPQKVILVLSDGYPAGSGYGGREAQQHIHQVCTWARSQGVEIVQIAIDESLRPADQAAMYGAGNWIAYTNERDLPRQLNKVLARFAK